MRLAKGQRSEMGAGKELDAALTRHRDVLSKNLVGMVDAEFF